MIYIHLSILLFTGLLSVHVLSLLNFEDPNNITFMNMAIDNQTGDVFVVGRNILYHLTSDLTLKKMIKTGPVKDHVHCLHPSYPCENNGTYNQNNDNTLLLIVTHLEEPLLLMCGRVYGLCQVRPLRNIESFSWVGPYNDSLGFIASNFIDGNSAQFYTDISGKLSLFSAATSSDDRLPHSAPFLSRKVLYQDSEQFLFKYAFENNTVHSAIRFDGNATRLVFNSFIHEKFLYVHFVYQKDNRSLPETRLARVCLEDNSFRSYAELRIECKSSGHVNRLSISSYFGKALPKMMKTGWKKLPNLLYVSFYKGPDYSSGSIICAFSMSDIQSSFNRGNDHCLKEVSGVTCLAMKWHQLLVYFRRSDDEICRTSNFPLMAYDIIKSERIVAGFTENISMFVVEEQIGQGIAILGTFSGYLFKLNLDKGKVYVSLKVTGEAVRKTLGFDRSHQYLYFLSGNKVTKFPIASCSVHGTCDSCLTDGKNLDPLKCGWCGDHCSTFDECSSNLFRIGSCPPVIFWIWPRESKLSGGLLMTINGRYFGSFIDEIHNWVIVAGSPCKIVTWNNKEVNCTLGPATVQITGPVHLNVSDRSDSTRGYNIVGSAESPHKFFYYTTPKIYGISPRRGPTSGGTLVILYGEHLDSGTKRDVFVGGRQCLEIGAKPEELMCLTGNVSEREHQNTTAIVERFETFEMELGPLEFYQRLKVYKNFVFVPDPEILDIQPGITTVSGLVNVTVTGTQLDCVQRPFMDVWFSLPHMKRELRSKISYCWPVPLTFGQKMTCKPPSLVLSHPNSTMPTRTQPVVAHMAFYMDGVQKLKDLHKKREQLTQLLYYPDPEFEPFHEIRKISNNQSVLDISAHFLDILPSTVNTHVIIGETKECKISEIAVDNLQCHLSSDFLANSSVWGSSLQVEAVVGNTRYKLGYIEVESRLEENETLQVWFWIVGIGITFLLLISYLIYRQCKRKAKKSLSNRAPELNMFQQNDYRPVPISAVVSRTSSVLSPESLETPILVQAAVTAEQFVDDETISLLNMENLIIPNAVLIVSDHQLGAGHFGCVYEGLLQTSDDSEGIMVAVKTLHGSRLTTDNVKQFLKEALTMKDFNHPNVLRLLGICLDEGIPMVVLPFMENGDLCNLLCDKTKTLMVSNLLAFAIDIAKGMAYLSEKHFIHRDLAARNCVLDSSLNVKVSDFGLSRDIYLSDYYSRDNSRRELPWKWMAIESLEDKKETSKSDVWSFGIVLWEIMTRGNSPYPGIPNWDLLPFLKAGNRLLQPEYCPNDLYKVMLACWHPVPDMRPSFEEIANFLPAFSKTTETLFEELLMSTGVSLNVCESPPSLTSEEGDSLRRRLRVLCLDGGGIRGMVLIQMLDVMEQMLGQPIGQFFDLVAGTSTGGILALVLATGKPMKQCRCLYFRLKDKVFVGGRPYNADLLETFLKNELGESTVMGDIEKPRLMITATRGNRKPVDLHIFRNYKSPLELLNQVEKDVLTNEVLPNPRDQLIWQAARATGAAPTYFRPTGPYIDGGLISNNPTFDAITEIHQCNQAHIAMGEEDQICDIKAIVSLGTGRPPLIPVNTIDVFRPDSLWGACRMALGVTNLGQLLVDQATQTDGQVTARAQAICHMLNIPYFRLNPQLTENVALDETNTKTLVRMLWETTAYMRCMRQELENLKDLLIA